MQNLFKLAGIGIAYIYSGTMLGFAVGLGAWALKYTLFATGVLPW